MHAGFVPAGSYGYGAQSLRATNFLQEKPRRRFAKGARKWKAATLADTSRKAQRLLGTKPVERTGIRWQHRSANCSASSVPPSGPRPCAASARAVGRRGAGRVDPAAQAGSADWAGLAHSAGLAAHPAGLVVGWVRPVGSAVRLGWD